jgi:hypothetical protein
MKKLLIGLLVLTSLSGFSADVCKISFNKYAVVDCSSPEVEKEIQSLLSAAKSDVQKISIMEDHNFILRSSVKQGYYGMFVRK